MPDTTFIAFEPGATGPYAAAQLLSILNEADKCGADLVRIKPAKDDPDGLDVEYLRRSASAVPFERIRRITGYLVGTVERFNDAKRAEERERVKHGLAAAADSAPSTFAPPHSRDCCDCAPNPSHDDC